MNVYIDTGVFIDFLIYRSHVGTKLRLKKRRKRTIKRLNKEATECFERIKRNKHNGITSVFTLYELEHCVYLDLKNSSRGKGVTYKKVFQITSSRPTILQGIAAANYYNITINDLNTSLFSILNTNTQLQMDGIEIGDSIHITNAIINNIDLIISTDNHILSLNKKYTNNAGIPIQCLDTNLALPLL